MITAAWLTLYLLIGTTYSVWRIPASIQTWRENTEVDSDVLSRRPMLWSYSTNPRVRERMEDDYQQRMEEWRDQMNQNVENKVRFRVKAFVPIRAILWPLWFAMLLVGAVMGVCSHGIDGIIDRRDKSQKTKELSHRKMQRRIAELERELGIGTNQ